MFEETVYDYDVLKTRLRETAFLTKGLRIVLRDLRTDPVVEKAFHYEGGIKEFVSYLNKSKTALYPDIIYCEGERDGVLVEVAMQHNDPIRKIRTVSSTTLRRRRAVPISWASGMR